MARPDLVAYGANPGGSASPGLGKGAVVALPPGIESQSPICRYSRVELDQPKDARMLLTGAPLDGPVDVVEGVAIP